MSDSLSTNAIQQRVASACELVAGVLAAVLVLVPDGVPLASVGGGAVSDGAALARSAARLLAERAAFAAAGPRAPFVEYALVGADRVVVIQRGRSCERVALVVACSTAADLGLLLASCRTALLAIERTVDLSAWEV